MSNITLAEIYAAIPSQEEEENELSTQMDNALSPSSVEVDTAKSITLAEIYAAAPSQEEEGPVCDSDYKVCSEPVGWVGLTCKGNGPAIKFFISKNTEINYIYHVKLDEYKISTTHISITRDTHNILWAEADQVYKLARSDLSLRTGNPLVIQYQCFIEPINQVARPLFEEISNAKSKNKL